MKNTLITFTLFVLIFGMFSNEVLALTIPNINIPTIGTAVPVTSTPTPTLVKMKFDPNLIRVFSTATPTPVTVVITQVVTPTIEAVKVTEAELSPAISQAIDMKTEEGETNVPTKTEEKTESKVDLKTWFMGITMGLLALIIIIQLFPKKKEDQ